MAYIRADASPNEVLQQQVHARGTPTVKLLRKRMGQRPPTANVRSSVKTSRRHAHEPSPRPEHCRSPCAAATYPAQPIAALLAGLHVGVTGHRVRRCAHGRDRAHKQWTTPAGHDDNDTEHEQRGPAVDRAERHDHITGQAHDLR